MAAKLISPTEHVQKSGVNRSAVAIFWGENVVERRHGVHEKFESAEEADAGHQYVSIFINIHVSKTTGYVKRGIQFMSSKRFIHPVQVLVAKSIAIRLSPKSAPT